MPAASLAALASGLQTAGAEVTLDVSAAKGAGRAVAREFRPAVASCATHLRRAWAEETPDVVHAVGYVATVAAVRESRGRLPVVATFYQGSPWEGLESWVASRLDGLVVHSTAEADRWRRHGVARERMRVLPPAVDVPDMAPRHSEPFGAVVTDATGPELDALVASMRSWPGRLVVVGSPSASRTAQVNARAEALGVLDRLVWRPAPRADALVQLVEESDLVVAVDGARSADLVSVAASRAVAAVAVDRDAHADLVISRATGLLVPERPSAVVLGEAVRQMLADPLMSRGYGAAAQVRAGAVQAGESVAVRALDLYQSVLPVTEPVAEPVVETDPVRQAERDRLVTEYLPLARQLAQRYNGRGQPLDDLVQVASLGLVKAAGRFDPEHGTSFPSYAIPTILGELRRHFRDHAWAVRVPRTLQETTLQVEKASQRIAQANGGEATVEQIAEELGLSDWEVLKAQQTSGEAFARTSLDHPVGEDGSGVLGDLVGDDDAALETVEEAEAVRRALQRLPEREREIILMRFFGDRTQMEIADHLGISQVHVSRTLTRTLAALRDHVLDEVPLPSSWSAQRS
jgi:RNA polymerase sigma-B factor